MTTNPALDNPHPVNRVFPPDAEFARAVNALTRSGKIMRRLLRDVAENRQVGDLTTLADSSVLTRISAGLGDKDAAER